MYQSPYDPSSGLGSDAGRNGGVVAKGEGTGDDGGAILVFMPGVAEIRRLQREIEKTGPTGGLFILQLHGR